MSVFLVNWLGIVWFLKQNDIIRIKYNKKQKNLDFFFSENILEEKKRCFLNTQSIRVGEEL